MNDFEEASVSLIEEGLAKIQSGESDLIILEVLRPLFLERPCRSLGNRTAILGAMQERDIYQ